MCKASQDLLSELYLFPRWCLAWWPSVNFILHLCACQKVEISHKMVANGYWNSSPALTTCSAFVAPLLEERVVLGMKYCRCTCNRAKHSSITQTRGCSMREMQEHSVLRQWMQFWVQFQWHDPKCMQKYQSDGIWMHAARQGCVYFSRLHVCAIDTAFSPTSLAAFADLLFANDTVLHLLFC